MTRRAVVFDGTCFREGVSGRDAGRISVLLTGPYLLKRRFPRARTGGGTWRVLRRRRRGITGLLCGPCPGFFTSAEARGESSRLLPPWAARVLRFSLGDSPALAYSSPSAADFLALQGCVSSSG